MDGLRRVAAGGQREVVAQLPQRIAQSGAGHASRVRRARQVERAGGDGGVVGTIGQALRLLGLADARGQQRQVLSQRLGHGDQCIGVTSQELQLELQQRRASSRRADVAGIERDLDHTAVAAAHDPGGAHAAGLVHGLQCPHLCVECRILRQRCRA